MEKFVYVANQVSMKIGEWSKDTSFTIVPLDDFDMVLGQEFMRKVKETPMPHLDCLAIMSQGDPIYVNIMKRTLR